MKNVSSKYYYALLSIAVCLLLFVFYFTHARYALIRQKNATVRKNSAILDGYKELSDDYKSAIIYASNFRGHASTQYSAFYESDAKDMLTDIRALRDEAEDSESARRADTLAQKMSKQLDWILRAGASGGSVRQSIDSELGAILDVQNIIDRGETHENAIAMIRRKQLEGAFAAIYTWLIILISVSATLIIIVVSAILWHVRKGQRQSQKIGVQKDRLDEIAWIQSHKVRSQVASILGLAQLFNYDDPQDPVNAEILAGFKECTEKLDIIIREIDDKTRVAA